MLPSWKQDPFLLVQGLACTTETHRVRQTALFSFSHSAHCSIFSFYKQNEGTDCSRIKAVAELLSSMYLSHIPHTVSFLCVFSPKCVFDNHCHDPRLKTWFFLPAEFLFWFCSPDSLRSGQGRRDPLQHHRSRCRSASEWDLQHRPHQWQHVCYPTARQRGESLFPCKK